MQTMTTMTLMMYSECMHVVDGTGGTGVDCCCVRSRSTLEAIGVMVNRVDVLHARQEGPSPPVDDPL